MRDRKQDAVYVPDDLAERVREDLDYGDSISAWLRGAVRLRLRAEEQGQWPPQDERDWQTDHGDVQLSTYLGDELRSTLAERLDWNRNKSEWLREAICYRLNEGADGLPEAEDMEATA